MTGNSLDVNPGLFYPPVMQGQRDLNIYPLYGQYSIAGTVDGPLFPSNGIEFLVYALGSDAVTGTAAPYTHTISQAATLPSMTIEKNVGGTESQQFYGCRVNKLTLQCAATNTEVTMSADIIGEGVNFLDTPSAITVVNEEPYTFAEATVSLFGQSVAVVNSLEIDIENGLVSTYVLNGTHYLQYLTPVTIAVSGTMDIIFDNFDDPTYGYYNAMINDHQNGTLNVTFAHASNGGSVEIILPEVRMSQIAIAPSLTNVVMQTVSWTAEYNATAGHTISAVVENSVQTAY